MSMSSISRISVADHSVAAVAATASASHDYEHLFSAAVGAQRGRIGKGMGEHLRAPDRLRFVTEALREGDYGPGIIWMTEDISPLSREECGLAATARGRTVHALLNEVARTQLTNMSRLLRMLTFLRSPTLVSDDEAALARITHRAGGTSHRALSRHLRDGSRDPESVLGVVRPHIRREIAQLVAERVRQGGMKEVKGLLGATRYTEICSNLKSRIEDQTTRRAFIASFCGHVPLLELLEYYDDHAGELFALPKRHAQTRLRNHLLAAGYAKTGICPRSEEAV